jgi:hypothetical protein
MSSESDKSIEKQIVTALHEQLSEIGKRSLEASAAYHEGNIPRHLLTLDNDVEGFFSEFQDNTSHNLSRMTVAIDNTNKEVSYAISGTRADQESRKLRADLYDDFLLSRGRLPSKVESLRSMNSRLIDRIKEVAKIDYLRQNNMVPQDVLSQQQQLDLSKAQKRALASFKYNFTGHSLGAALSDCAVTDMYLQLKGEGVKAKNISSTSFDNPGAKSAVLSMIKAHNKEKPEHKVSLGMLQDDISYKAFNNSKNFINTMDQQISSKYRIMKEGDKEPKPGSIMFGYLKTVLKRVPVIRAFIFLCSMGSLSKQLKSHSLTNFVDVLVGKDKEGNSVEGSIKHKGVILTVEDIVQNREPIKYESKVFAALDSADKVSSEKIKGQVYVMVDPKNPKRKISASQMQVQKAYKKAYSSEIDRQKSKDKAKYNVKTSKSFASKFTRKKTKMTLFTAKDLYEGREPGKPPVSQVGVTVR